MTQVGFETTIPVFERTKAVHGLDRAVTVIGRHHACLSIERPLFEKLRIFLHNFLPSVTSSFVLLPRPKKTSDKVFMVLDR
jgi:hypothetical protein